MEVRFEVVPELVIDSAAADARGPIATLGPPGTSSEAAGHRLAALLGTAARTELYPSYEDACAAVLAGRAARLLVANAYHGVNEFYMNQALALERVFVLDTPQYGLASRPNAALPLACAVVTHPAPRPLVRQLMPPGYGVNRVDYATSTSAAAERVAEGDVDLALTTKPAAHRHGLRFISPTRPIRMLWSVFVKAQTGYQPC